MLLNDQIKAKEYLDKCSDYFNRVSCSEPYIYSSYHRIIYIIYFYIYYIFFIGVCSQYYLAIGPPELYFSHTLSYISYTPVNDISPEDRINISMNISIASLIGKDIYNYGEILQTPVFQYLINTPYNWLYDLIKVINEGNIDNFNTLIGVHMNEIQKQPALCNKLDIIKQKAVIMALLQLVFNKPSKNRLITFEEVCIATKMPLDQVEYIVMRTMSDGLITGEIDEVNQTINITNLKPKVLNLDEIRSLAAGITMWMKNVHELYVDIENQAKTLFA